jgi:hypothetical protein
MKVTIYKEKIQWFFPWGLSAGSLAAGIIYWLPISSRPCPGLLVHGWGRDCRKAAWFPYHTVLLDMCFDCCNGFYQLKSEMFANSNVSLVVCFKDHRYLFPVCEFNCRLSYPIMNAQGSLSRMERLPHFAACRVCRSEWAFSNFCGFWIPPSCAIFMGSSRKLSIIAFATVSMLSFVNFSMVLLIPKNYADLIIFTIALAAARCPEPLIWFVVPVK